MLMGLLPALRDLRAPLVAGYIVVVAAYLAFHDHVPSSGKATGALRSLYELAQWTGNSGVLVGATFLAFLAGSVIQFGAEAFGRIRNTKRGGPKYDLQDASLISTYVDQRVADDPRLLDEARHEISTDVSAPDEVKTAMVAAISRELPRIARRMRGSENELYDEYDRLIGEAQFREITLIPLALLIGALSVTWSLFLLPAVVVLPLLKRQAVYQREAGHEVVVDALLVGKVAAPYLERLERRADARNTVNARPVNPSGT
ncbi:hypothetical protein [Planosporangium mesophilum]|uniref:Uncharacterized protein n=1 Tax=Planosporangium mesophilum TaxID=689768 RepID=A0A8J3TIS5_9ACTN|nr:hypothetical protein [Planosporangium mesophilum]NJC86649.1 hypothetical protein [Planosporangium mesophilum]GII25409.1 hypothetical protein Pme01_50060 [Planosporangium mesophilum]